MEHLFKFAVLTLSIASPVAGIAAGWKRKGLLWWYLWAALAADITGVVLIRLNGPRFWNSNLFLLLEFVLISIYIIRNIAPTGAHKISLAIVCGTGALFLANTVRKSICTLNYDDGALLYAMLIILLIGGFYKIITDIELLKIERSPFFIFCCGYLLYVAGSLIMLVFKKYIDEQNHALMSQLWVLHNVLNVLKNAAVARALYLYKSSCI